MKIFSKTLLATALMGATAAAHAELSFNIGAASNYIFRGVSQTGDDAAVSGGVDWGHDSGVYLGTWMSNVDFGGDENAEVDFYGGIAGELGNGLGWDVGALYYYYPGGGNIDYAEVYGALSLGMFSGGLNYTVYGETDGDTPFDSGDIYAYGSIDLPLNLGEGVGLSIFGGYYWFDHDGDVAFVGDDGPVETTDYGHYGVSLSKDAGDWGSVSANLEYVDGSDDETPAADDDALFWVGWSKEF
jgi:uncharacterized protein (TIGR02001 family)